jgi:hypothetical protein
VTAGSFEPQIVPKHQRRSTEIRREDHHHVRARDDRAVGAGAG